MDARLTHKHQKCYYRVRTSLPYKLRLREAYVPISFRQIIVMFHFSRRCQPRYDHLGVIINASCNCLPFRAGKPNNQSGLSWIIQSPLCKSFSYHIEMDGFSYENDFLSMVKRWYSCNKKKQRREGYLKITKKHWNRLFVQKEGFINNKHLVSDVYLRSFKLNSMLDSVQQLGFEEKNGCKCKVHRTLTPSSMVIMRGKKKRYSLRKLRQMGYIISTYRDFLPFFQEENDVY